jgi:Uma2 family endonuclease
MTTRDVDQLEQVIVAELPRWVATHPSLRAQLWDALSDEAQDRASSGTPSGALFCPPPMTYPEFLAWADEDTLAEWIALEGTDRGEIVMTSPASDRHQDIARFLTMVIGIYVETQQLGIVRPAPFQMKLEHGREPDLLFLAQDHLGRLRDTYLAGPADVVVEIISPESAGRDRGEKFYEYEHGGVSEYWLIDASRHRFESYMLDEQGRYMLSFSGERGRYESHHLPNFWLQAEWLWQEPLLHPLPILGEIMGVDPALVDQFMQALGGPQERRDSSLRSE